MGRDMKHDKRMRLLLRILFFVIVLFTPVAMTSLKFEIITEFNGYKASFIGIVVVIILFYRFRTSVMQWINNWEYSVFKHVIIGLNRVIVPILFYFIIKAAQQEMANLVFVVEWIAITSVVGYTIVLPAEQHYDYYIKRELRKQEYREVRDE